MGAKRLSAKKFISLAFFVLFVFSFLPLTQATPFSNTAVLFVNESCGHCKMYLSNLKMLLESNGFLVEEKNMINDLSARNEWAEFHQKNGIPLEFQGHLTAVLNGSLAIEGHVPLGLVQQTFEKYPKFDFPLLVLFQDEMVSEDQIDSYKVWTPETAVECKKDQALSECSVLPFGQSDNMVFLSGLVGLSGIAAGLHPCTIGVLLFFLAFLFSVQLLRKNAFLIGAAYIVGVFAAYFLIGFGLLNAMVFAEPHFAAKASAVLVFVLGLFNIVRYFVPSVKGFGFPGFSKNFIAQNVQRVSVPAAFFVGLVVGVCSFGCTAGIYFSVLGFMVSEPSLGVVLLFLYNFLFVLPLVVILFLATNPLTVEKAGALQAKYSGKLFLAAGILMLISAIALWLYVGGS